MNAAPILHEIAHRLKQHRLEAVLIGHAAAALQGAPVTTLDFDFLFRKTPANLAKLKRLADDLSGHILRPYYPASGLYRLVVEDSGLQLDFMTDIHGIRSFAALRSRAIEVSFGSDKLLVADLADIIRSKKAAGRARDLASLEVLEKTLDEKRRKKDQTGSP